MRWVFLVLVVVCWMVGPAIAGVCGAREGVVEELEKKYGEKVVASGVSAAGDFVEVFSGQEGRIWTIVVTSPQGISCLLLWGEGWRKVEDSSAT